MRIQRIAASVALLMLCLWSPLLADWTATGIFQYMDRQYNETGFTGTEVPAPVRAADFEIVDVNAKGKSAVLARGATGLDGSFSILVPDSKTRDILVRVISRSSNTGDLDIDVRESSSGKAKYYAAASVTIQNHSPSANLDFGTSVIQIGQGGEPFNIYDQMVRGADYVASLEGARPSSQLATVWADNSGIANSSYDIAAGQIIMRATAGYDDTVILHEMGHFVIREYSKTDAFAGSHTFSMCFVDLKLAWEEGWATYFGNSALRHHGLAGSHIYTRTNGGPGAGNLVRSANLETDNEYFCQGSTSEVNVFTMLWDISDGPSTPDETPGVDDSHDLLDLDDSEIWEVMTGYMPTITNTSMEKFWDGWFLAPAQNGFRSEMIDLADHMAIEYYEDAFEVNDLAVQASSIPPDGSTTHATLFRDPEQDGSGAVDHDFFSFAAGASQLYIAETFDLLGAANTSLRIFDTDGVTLLAVNKDKAAGDDASKVEWVAPRTDTFYVKVSHEPDFGIYGSYDLVLRVDVPGDADGDGYDTTTDCNDNNPDINPGATETCDGVDEDCDGVVDNGFDLDGDGFTSCAGDCDDSDPNANPGMEEIPSNGVDDNCNGQIDEQPQTDLVTITRASYNGGPGKLTVEATSDQQPGVTLTVVGFGQMSYNASKGKYVYQSSKNTPNPGTVTVESSGGGSDTAAVN